MYNNYSNMSRYIKGNASEKEKLLPQKERTRPLVEGAQIQNVPSARVYVFGNEDLQEDELCDDEAEMTELRPRGAAKKQYTKEREDEAIYFEVCIEEGDTLQNIALKYGCPVSELKRINKFIQDQDFYARKFLKVPIKRYGLLTEVIAQENATSSGPKLTIHGAIQNGLNQPSEDDESYLGFDDPDDDQIFVQKVGLLSPVIKNSKQQAREAERFLRSMDTDLEKIRESTKTYKDTLDDVTVALTCTRIRPLEITKRYKCDGADCGARWWSVLALMLIIGIVTPLFFFLYYEYVKS